MNIIKIFLPIVNPLFRSKLFWAVVVGIGLLLWLTKFDLSKVVKIIKLLVKFGADLVAVLLTLFFSPFIKYFQETEDSRE